MDISLPRQKSAKKPPETMVEYSVLHVREYVKMRLSHFYEDQRKSRKNAAVRMKFAAHRQMARVDHKLAKRLLKKVV